jgi:hypothetical protein
VKDPRLRPDNVFRQARVVGQDTNEFAAEGSILRLITTKIQEDYEWRPVHVLSTTRPFGRRGHTIFVPSSYIVLGIWVRQKTSTEGFLTSAKALAKLS